MIGAVKAARRSAMLLVPEQVGQVLEQRAAERDIEYLHSAADAEHRQIALDRAADQRDLGLVSLRNDALGRRVGLGAVHSRIDIVAAGEDQPVDPVKDLGGVFYDLRVGRDHDRQSAGALDRVDVGVREQRRGPAPDAPCRVDALGADSDHGTAHRLCEASGRCFAARRAEPCRSLSLAALGRSRRSAGTCTERSRA